MSTLNVRLDSLKRGISYRPPKGPHTSMPTNNVLLQNSIYYTPYEVLEEQRISFADYAKSKNYYNQLAFLFEEGSSRAPYTKKEANFILEVAKHYLTKSESFLDIACGVGRHDREISNQGYTVFGVDASEKLLDLARSKDDKTTYVSSDMRHFELGREFDLAFCIWDAYVYLSREEDMKAFLEQCHKHLKKGGLLILDSRNYFKEGLKIRIQHGNFTVDQYDIEFIARKNRMSFADKVSESIFIYNINDLSTGETHIIVDQELVKMYSFEDLEKFFGDKFKIVDAYGDFDTQVKFDPLTSERMIVIAKTN